VANGGGEKGKERRRCFIKILSRTPRAYTMKGKKREKREGKSATGRPLKRTLPSLATRRGEKRGERRTSSPRPFLLSNYLVQFFVPPSLMVEGGRRGKREGGVECHHTVSRYEALIYSFNSLHRVVGGGASKMLARLLAPKGRKKGGKKEKERTLEFLWPSRRFLSQDAIKKKKKKKREEASNWSTNA